MLAETTTLGHEWCWEADQPGAFPPPPCIHSLEPRPSDRGELGSDGSQAAGEGESSHVKQCRGPLCASPGWAASPDPAAKQAWRCQPRAGHANAPPFSFPAANAWGLQQEAGPGQGEQERMAAKGGALQHGRGPPPAWH